MHQTYVLAPFLFMAKKYYRPFFPCFRKNVFLLLWVLMKFLYTVYICLLWVAYAFDAICRRSHASEKCSTVVDSQHNNIAVFCSCVSTDTTALHCQTFNFIKSIPNLLSFSHTRIILFYSISGGLVLYLSSIWNCSFSAPYTDTLRKACELVVQTGYSSDLKCQMYRFWRHRRCMYKIQ